MNSNVDYLLKTFNGDKDKVIEFLIERNIKLEKIVNEFKHDVANALIKFRKANGEI